MTLIAMNSSHPRELTSTTLRAASDGLGRGRPRRPPTNWAVMPLFYRQLLTVTEGVVMQVR